MTIQTVLSNNDNYGFQLSLALIIMNHKKMITIVAIVVVLGCTAITAVLRGDGG
jgi:hypothetical protein